MSLLFDEKDKLHHSTYLSLDNQVVVDEFDCVIVARWIVTRLGERRLHILFRMATAKREKKKLIGKSKALGDVERKIRKRIEATNNLIPEWFAERRPAIW